MLRAECIGWIAGNLALLNKMHEEQQLVSELASEQQLVPVLAKWLAYVSSPTICEFPHYCYCMLFHLIGIYRQWVT